MDISDFIRELRATIDRLIREGYTTNQAFDAALVFWAVSNDREDK